MELAILQESSIDDNDFSRFHNSLASVLNKRGLRTTVYQPRTNLWQDLTHLGPLCRVFSLQKYWNDITRHSLVFGSPLTVLPFLDAPVKPVISFHYITEALERSLRYPDYGEETSTLKRHLETARAAGVAVDGQRQERYDASKEAEIAACHTNYPIVAATRNVKEDLIKLYDIKPNRITILNYGVEPQWFNQANPISDYNELFHELNPKDPLLIYYARLRSGLTGFLAEGVDRIIEIFQRIRDLKKLVILDAEDPAYRTLFRQLGALVINNPPPEHLPYLFQMGGIFVQTARYEAQNLPLIQAMASGLSIVSFPVGLAEEVVETGRDGFLVQNLIQLVAKVDFLRSNPDKTKEFGKNAQRIAKQKFILSHIAEQYQKYFSEFKD